MSDVDYGLILGSTNDEIWGEEAAKSAGTRALMKVMTCDNPACGMSTRLHAQAMFDNVETLKDACDFLAPFEHESLQDLRERLFTEFQPVGYPDDDFDVSNLLRVEPQEDGSLRLFEPSGEEIDLSDLPPEHRAMIEQVTRDLLGMGGGDDLPKPPGTLH